MGKVESINTAAIAGHSIDGETAEWLGKIGDALHAKLAAVGLVAPRKTLAPMDSLGEFMKNYMTGRTVIKPSTRCNLNVCKARLVEFFGTDRALDEITVADTKRWEIWLKERYAKATVGRTIRRAKQFFQVAIDGEIIAKNPFAKIKAPGQANEARKFFVALDVAYKVLGPDMARCGLGKESIQGCQSQKGTPGRRGSAKLVPQKCLHIAQFRII